MSKTIQETDLNNYLIRNWKFQRRSENAMGFLVFRDLAISLRVRDAKLTIDPNDSRKERENYSSIDQYEFVWDRIDTMIDGFREDQFTLDQEAYADDYTASYGLLFYDPKENRFYHHEIVIENLLSKRNRLAIIEMAKYIESERERYSKSIKKLHSNAITLISTYLWMPQKKFWCGMNKSSILAIDDIGFERIDFDEDNEYNLYQLIANYVENDKITNDDMKFYLTLELSNPLSRVLELSPDSLLLNITFDSSFAKTIYDEFDNKSFGKFFEDMMLNSKMWRQHYDRWIENVTNQWRTF